MNFFMFIKLGTDFIEGRVEILLEFIEKVKKLSLYFFQRFASSWELKESHFPFALVAFDFYVVLQTGYNFKGSIAWEDDFS